MNRRRGSRPTDRITRGNDLRTKIDGELVIIETLDAEKATVAYRYTSRIDTDWDDVVTITDLRPWEIERLAAELAFQQAQVAA